VARRARDHGVLLAERNDQEWVDRALAFIRNLDTGMVCCADDVRRGLGTSPAMGSVFSAAAAGRGFHIGDDGKPSDTSKQGSGHKWVGTLVMPYKRREIVTALGFNERTWNDNWRYRWEAKGMAHRCGRGGPDALFFRPVLGGICLWCEGKLCLENPSGGEGQSHQVKGKTPPRQRGNPVQKRDVRTGTEKQGEMPEEREQERTWVVATVALRRGDYDRVRTIALALGDLKIAALALQAEEPAVWRELNDRIALARKAEQQPDLSHA
jgi:hypothetical protein